MNSLQKRNDSLRSQLIHEQLKHGAYNFSYFRKFLIVINEYKKLRSFFKVAFVVDITQHELIQWYVRGQTGNPKFRGFYLAINAINNQNDVRQDVIVDEEIPQDEFSGEDGEFIISQYGDGWSYKTFIDGEKIFIISNELKTLKEKVKAKRLPLN